MRFPGTGVADEAERFAFADPVTGSELVDRGRVDVRVRVEIEVTEPLAPREASRRHAPNRGAPIAIIALREQ